MKTLIATALSALITATAAPALAGDVTITLNNVQARPGQLLVALQTEGQFMRQRGAFGERVDNPAAGTTTVVFHDVPPGDYAVFALHDEDGNGEMTMRGQMPAEGWSTYHADQLRGAPTFAQVKFTVPASGPVDLTLPMVYFF